MGHRFMQFQLVFGKDEKYKMIFSLGNPPKYTFKTGFLGSFIALGSSVACSYFGHELVQSLVADNTLFTSDYLHTLTKSAGLITGAVVGGLAGIIIATGLPGGEQRFEK